MLILPWRAPAGRGGRFRSGPAGAFSRVFFQFSQAEECGSTRHAFVETWLSQLSFPLTHSHKQAIPGAVRMSRMAICNLRTLIRTGWTLRVGEHQFWRLRLVWEKKSWSPLLQTVWPPESVPPQTPPPPPARPRTPSPPLVFSSALKWA